jgi:DNA-binding NarL/FixJ family response regulator
MSPIRILLVDDSVYFLGAARSFLAGRPGLFVIDDAVNGRQALTQDKGHAADLVLLDLNLAGLNGLEVAQRLKAQPAPPRVIIVTLHNTPEYRQAALRAGADGFVGKDEFTTALLPLISALFPGHGSFDRPTTQPPLPSDY